VATTCGISKQPRLWFGQLLKLQPRQAFQRSQRSRKVDEQQAANKNKRRVSKLTGSVFILTFDIASIDQIRPQGFFEKGAHRHASFRRGALDLPPGVDGDFERKLDSFIGHEPKIAPISQEWEAAREGGSTRRSSRANGFAFRRRTLPMSRHSCPASMSPPRFAPVTCLN